MTLTQQEIQKLFNSLKVEVIPTYEGDIPTSVFDLFPSKKRVIDHYTSRLALIKAIDLPAVSNYSDVLIENHHHLVKYPNLVVSVSHTNTVSGAAVAEKEVLESIGIDIELIERKIRPGILKFFLREDDEIEDMLELWCVKEAAFKAIYPICHQKKPLVLKDISILRDGTFTIHSNQNLNGYFQIKKEKGYLLALAVIVKIS